MTEWVRRLTPLGKDWDAATLRQRHVAEATVIADFVERLGFAPTAWAVETAARVGAELGIRSGEMEKSATWGAHSALSFELGLLLELSVILDEHFDPDRIDPRIIELTAANAFQRGVPLDLFTHSVWSGHSRAQLEILQMLPRLVPATQLPDEIGRTAALVNAFAIGYVALVRQAYEAERQRSRGRVVDSQRRAILEIARGAKPGAASAQFFPEGFQGGHLYAMTWTAGTDGATEQADRFAERCGRTLEARETVVFEDDGLTHVWWRLGPETRDAVGRVRAVERPAELRVALGVVGDGLGGFRQTYATARKALRVARLGAAGEFWAYPDIAHIALLAEDREAMAQFVREEIGPLLGPGQRRRDTRDTVRLYLAHGRSRVAVAELLHLSPKTIGYRVDQASHRMGTRINDSALNIRLALDLAHWFPHLAEGAPSAAPAPADPR